jgi:hypothetical protein
MAYSSQNGKVVNGKFVHTKRTPPKGYRALPDQVMREMADKMINDYKNPFSKLSQMTAQLRAAGVLCMKDDLDHGADIYEICRNSMFVA